MLSKLLSYFDPQQRTLQRYEQLADQIDSFEPKLQKLSDEKLRARTTALRSRYAKGESLDTLLPEAFAVVREASRRTLGLRHYRVQLMAGMAFHEGKIAEQKTGEGKTLSATLALYLNALTGEGAHLITVNDYLAQIGAGWMGQLYHLLGLSVGVVIHDQSYLYDPDFTGEERGDERLEHFRPVPRKEAYAADITYGTNNEFGFDYLRDNMAQRLEQQVQREHVYAIVDEADSILIDEARTPLIISAPDAEPTEKYAQFNGLVRQLSANTDYVVDEKLRTAVLTDLGVKRLERQLKVSNLYEESFDTIHHVEQALKAHTVFHRDKDYVVRDGEVIIVDEHTGRLMVGRRYSDGLHQAIEAKEGVAIQQESRTLATISLQNYFRLYRKLAGMSGTAVTAAEELRKIYNLDVVVIPTNNPNQRVDHPDVIYKSMRAKYSALSHEVEQVHATGRPILLGTRSIEQNQILADLLSRRGVPFQALNAKNHEREAFIIAEAGKPGAITIATNIAGRGVDIVLGGAPPERRQFETQKAYEKAQREWQKAHDAVVASGGLHVIGSERHESRRIDHQLRGRAGRQGDPGSSRFYVSLEDEIMRIFGGEQIIGLMEMLKFEEDMPIEHPLMNKALTQAQIKVEGFFFDQRKSLVEYDDVMNRQREVIYSRRQRLLTYLSEGIDKGEERNLEQSLARSFQEQFESSLALREGGGLDDTELQTLVTELSQIIPFETNSLDAIKKQLEMKSDQEERMNFLTTLFHDTYKLRRDALGSQVWREVELFAQLSSIDEQWMNHLDDMTQLRDSIWLRGNREQALAEYKKEAFALFTTMLQRAEREALRRLFRIQVQQPQPQPPQDVQLSGPAKTSDEQMNESNQSKRVLKPAKGSKKDKSAKKRRKGSYL